MVVYLSCVLLPLWHVGRLVVCFLNVTIRSCSDKHRILIDSGFGRLHCMLGNSGHETAEESRGENCHDWRFRLSGRPGSYVFYRISFAMGIRLAMLAEATFKR